MIKKTTEAGPTIIYNAHLDHVDMVEQYTHTLYKKVRTDYIERVIKGNTAIYIKIVIAGEEAL